MTNQLYYKSHEKNNGKISLKGFRWNLNVKLKPMECRPKSTSDPEKEKKKQQLLETTFSAVDRTRNIRITSPPQIHLEMSSSEKPFHPSLLFVTDMYREKYIHKMLAQTGFDLFYRCNVMLSINWQQPSPFSLPLNKS